MAFVLFPYGILYVTKLKGSGSLTSFKLTSVECTSNLQLRYFTLIKNLFEDSAKGEFSNINYHVKDQRRGNSLAQTALCVSPL